MTYTFDPTGPLVVIPVFVAGPAAGGLFNFAIDTGATYSAMSGLILERLGYARSQARGNYVVRTAGGATRTGVLRVSRFGAFGRHEANWPLLWLPLDPGSRGFGVLGLDFLRGRHLTLDFARGKANLRDRRPWWRLWR